MVTMPAPLFPDDVLLGILIPLMLPLMLIVIEPEAPPL